MNSTCQHKDLVQSLMDDELTDDKKRFMEAHLDTCGVCRAEMAAVKKLSSLLGELDEIELSPGFDRTFWKKVDEYERKRLPAFFGGRVQGGWRMVFAPLLVTLIIVSGVISYKKASMKPFTLTVEEFVLVDHMDVLNDFDVVNNLDLMENMDILDHMKEAT